MHGLSSQKEREGKCQKESVNYEAADLGGKCHTIDTQEQSVTRFIQEESVTRLIPRSKVSHDLYLNELSNDLNY